MIPVAPPGLEVSTAAVSADPGLLSADPAMMASASHAFGAGAQKLQATGQASAKASAQLSTYWLGKGVQAFDTASAKANAGTRAAAGALAGAAGGLMTLSAQITAAQALARKAMALAEQSAQAASALQSAASSEQAVAALPASATSQQAMAARAPTAGQVAQADAISADAALATQLMAEANTAARQAWAQAAATFDAVTAEAPSVRAAVANARAQAARAHQGGGGSLFGGIINLLGAAALPVGSAAADFFSDGAAAAATPEEAGAEDALLTDGVADLTGGSTASAAEVATAEEEAAAEVNVDGTRVGTQVAEDAAGGPEPQAVSENSVSEPLTTDELKALDDYTGNAYYRSLNAALRDGTPLTPEQQTLSDNLSSALAKMPDYEGVVYRGLNLTPEQIAEYQPGETVTWDGFTSTDTANPFPGNTQVVIESSSGKLISAYSQVATENEVLFDKGSQFVVEGNQEVNGTTYLTLRQVP